ncbi:FAD-dependent oxidoreductase [Halovenus sp. WSH3]|uniref:FAD-dependent oxidoreductase n=1 Tax=Halovenus carboxidivorans TaxID=2692199 RepID=A0A6B0T957_9EURY|nr:NAD(P)/FAD-dependent oxidoreductase [Halovenus carboxidivorans]MXR51882.1 FAD-dependent oxidoreductase [Halovenus carboxidivorans]
MSGRASEGTDYDCEVLVVGGGPAGCSAGLFTARAGLDTVIFDRGRSSLRQCAHLENYLGFPAGIDIESFYEQIHDHARTAGCEITPDLVERVERGDGGGFVVTPQERAPVTARRVVAATRYDAGYLRGLDDEEALFETKRYGEEEYERFDREYADEDGRTPVEGLYVASPSAAADTQAIMAAGRGARVAHRVIADAERADGYWECVAGRPDWVRRDAELDAEWRDRRRWIEWFDDRYGAEAPVDPDSERYEQVRASVVERARASYIGREEITARAETGLGALVSALGEQRVLEAIDDERIREYLGVTGENAAGES